LLIPAEELYEVIPSEYGLSWIIADRIYDLYNTASPDMKKSEKYYTSLREI
jgi:hypothetical protein